MFDGFKPKPIERPAPGRVQGEKPKRGMFDGLKLDATPATPSPARADRGEDRAFARAVERTSRRSEEHTSELQSLMRISYAVFCLKKKSTTHRRHSYDNLHYKTKITKITQYH